MSSSKSIHLSWSLQPVRIERPLEPFQFARVDPPDGELLFDFPISQPPPPPSIESIYGQFQLRAATQPAIASPQKK